MKPSPEKAVSKVNDNGFHHLNGGKLGSKNRLRIHGLATLQRENHPDITATYDYNTSYASNFFEEDVNQLESFELNKIALGMTIYKKEDLPKISSNGHHHKNGLNGHSLLKYSSSSELEPGLLTDVIWSRMDMVNPGHNPNAYIIKQYYDNKSGSYEVPPHHGERCNTFICGFISCFMIMAAIGYALMFYSKDLYLP